MPLTDWKERYEIAPWMVKVEPDVNNKLTKISSADCFQTRSLSEQRCIKKIGEVSNEVLANVRKALATVLNIE